eukprot:SAG31_NODE_27292_length_428_cov_1.009119_1_plen_41_part_01
MNIFGKIGTKRVLGPRYPICSNGYTRNASHSVLGLALRCLH